jgi:hypothetical protein
LTSIIGQGLLAKSAIKRELKEAMLEGWTLANKGLLARTRPEEK